MIGNTLGHYRILEKIGEGGMGVVYRARDTRLDRDVALKVLPKEFADDPDRRRRFEREAKAVAALRHPNIVMIHSVEEIDGVHFLTMELVEGKPLSDVVPEDGLPLDTFFSYAIALSDAVSAAHAKGIAHRDLKPANIMVERDGRLSVLDFGLAKLFERNVESDKTIGAESDTGEGRILGTVAYMSPEQAEGEAVDHRSDVFSLGIILYEMATGRRPFRGKTNMSTLSSIIKDDPPSVSEVRSSLPRHLGRIVSHCLAKDPERRYQSALDVRNELDALKGEVSSGSIDLPAGTTRTTPRVARKWWLGGIGGAAVAIAVLIIALWPKEERLPADRQPVSSRPAATDATANPSIAVLPFANMSDDPSNEYFSDGLAEELLNLLAKVPGLRVAARTSSFYFKEHAAAVSEIGKELGVSTILEGSVRRAGNRVRITAQLIKADDGFHMWSETYDRELDDIFAIQEDIATRVVEALKIKLLGQAAAQLAKRPTENVEAYDAYLLGLQRMARRRSDSLNEAVEYFSHAVDLDPGFGLAYARLAQVYQLLSDYGTLTTDEANAAAADMVGRAMEIDDQMGEAYAALGLLKSNKGEPDAAIAAYKRAIELNPNDALAYMWYALQMRGIDRADAWELLNKSMDLDPLAPVANVNVGYWLLQDNKPQDALAQFRHVTEIDPGFPAAYDGMARVYATYLDEPEEALKWQQKGAEVDPGNPDRRIQLGWAYYQAGRTEDAMETFQTIIDADPGYAPAYNAIADVHQNQGELDEAIRWGKKAVDRDRTNMGFKGDMVGMYFDLDDETSAIQWIEQIEKDHPDSPFLLIGRSKLYEFRGELDKAEKRLREVGEARPEWFRGDLAAYDLIQGRPDDARRRYADVFPALLEDENPDVNASNLDAAIRICFTLQKPEEKARRDLLLGMSEGFLLSRTPAVRRNRYAYALVSVWLLQGRQDEAYQLAKRNVRSGLISGWWERSDPVLQMLQGDPRWEALQAEILASVRPMREALAADGLASR